MARHETYGASTGPEWSPMVRSSGARHLSRADFFVANLSSADLTYANLTSALLTGADLRDALLTGANLTDVLLTGADPRDVLLTGADLRHALLIGANLTGALLTGTLLTGVSLIGAYLAHANLLGAILTLARADSGLPPAAPRAPTLLDPPVLSSTLSFGRQLADSPVHQYPDLHHDQAEQNQRPVTWAVGRLGPML
jgi:hypothetical protein